jgi:hypothetical protein
MSLNNIWLLTLSPNVHKSFNFVFFNVFIFFAACQAFQGEIIRRKITLKVNDKKT